MGSDIDNDALSYTITQQPTKGVLGGTAPNLTYTPNPGFSGEDTFVYRACDESGPCDSASVTIVVAGESYRVRERHASEADRLCKAWRSEVRRAGSSG